MSQPWQQQTQSAAGFGHPGFGQPYPYQPGTAPPVPPPPARRTSPGPAIALTAAVAVAALLLYGFLTGMVVDLDALVEEAIRTGDSELDIAQLTWLAAAVGALVGLPAAKLAPGRPGLYWLAGVLALAAMLLGETFATAVLAAEASDGAESAFELFFDDFSDLWESWTENAHGLTWPLVALAPAGAVLTGYLLGHPRKP
ncbi:hypothetical protein [Streptomyces sp. URMC 129]|uniref:hypothetical protein n=1 Tax=Streptomyces sp. URMC 129 TaxID=3423407 RepID=UPI003F19CC05